VTARWNAWRRRNIERERAKERERYARNPDRQKRATRKYRTTEKGRASLKRTVKKYRATEKGQAAGRRHMQKQRREKPEAVRAHQLVKSAKWHGELVPQPCEVCGAGNTHAHHDDYSHPLVVRWLCPAHHQQEHLKKKGSP